MRDLCTELKQCNGMKMITGYENCDPDKDENEYQALRRYRREQSENTRGGSQVSASQNCTAKSIIRCSKPLKRWYNTLTKDELEFMMRKEVQICQHLKVINTGN